MSGSKFISDPLWNETLERGTGKFFYQRDLSPEENGKFLNKREEYRVSVSWHIPNEELVEKIVKHSPIISVGAGYAYTESIAKSRGCDIVCSDISPDEENGWCKGGNNRCEILKISADEAIKMHADRNVYMAWPPYDDPMAYEVVEKMEIGRILIYVGEGDGGCTGDFNFFEYLDKNFKVIDSINIPSWSGIYDNCTIYKKIK